MRWIFALSLLSIGLAFGAPTPTPITCASGQITWLSGNGTPRMPLLISFAHRPVGGGSVNAAGHWALPLQVGHERPGLYPIEVRSRGSGALIAAFECAVGVALPTQAPTAAPAPTQPPAPTQAPAEEDFDRNGDGRVTCDDFDTRAEATVALDAGHENLDNNGDGIPCEDLPPD